MKLYGSGQSDRPVRRWQRLLMCVVVFAVGLALVLFAGRELLFGLRDDAAAQSEYARLRELSAAVLTTIVPPQQQIQQQQPTVSHPEEEAEILPVGVPGNIHAPEYFPADITDLPPPPEQSPETEDITSMLRNLSEINPDFVGWIVIPGTTVDYPIVRGRDNSRYLYTTFSGERNPAGAIFMDYRCTGGFDAPVSLIHGHNMRGDSMFSPLPNYLNQEFMENHPNIVILTADGETLIYRIFKARLTDAWDGVFAVNYGNAEEAVAFFGIEADERLLVLSTCAGGADRNARLLVYAVNSAP